MEAEVVVNRSLEIRRILDLPSIINVLRIEASHEGFRCVERLVIEWDSATNRFVRPGEILAGAFDNGHLVAVGGLNIDPYVDDITVARLRHLYVLKHARRRGVAASLVHYLLDTAQVTFTTVRLLTDSVEATLFYEKIGFSRVYSGSATHIIGVG